jgi:hypothetical protein
MGDRMALIGGCLIPLTPLISLTCQEEDRWPEEIEGDHQGVPYSF